MENAVPDQAAAQVAVSPAPAPALCVPAGTFLAEALLAEHRPRVYGELMAEMPRDLYIPPDALKIILDSFEGPLDLSLIHI